MPAVSPVIAARHAYVWRVLRFLTFVLLTASLPASGGVLVLTEDRAIEAADVRIGSDGDVVVINPDGTVAARIAAEKLVLLRFDVRARRTQPRAWLYLHDGRRISGDSLEIGPDRAVLRGAGRVDTTVSRDELAVLFFRAAPPEPKPPAAGVRIISTNGDILDAPVIELTDVGVLVEIDPESEPLHLARDRVAGVIWPARAAAGPTPRDPTRRLVDLRTGERLIGQVVSLDGQVLLLKTGNTSRTIHRREVGAIWFGRRTVRAAEDQVPAAPASEDRPRYRRGLNALGAPLRLGRRVYHRGLGLRGPETIDVPVPAGARWFLAYLGADADAAPFALISLEVLVDGQRRMHHQGVAPGELARPVAVAVQGATQITLGVHPSGDEATGCLGDFADAIFIID